MIEIGGNLVKGIWDGISNMTQWIKDKIFGFAKGITSSIKKFFGIESPSKIFKEEIGKNLALGVGEGFSDEMEDVIKDMQNAMPTELDTNINTMLDSSGMSGLGAKGFSIENMIFAFQEALKGMGVMIDGDKMGELVVDKIEKVVYA